MDTEEFRTAQLCYLYLEEFFNHSDLKDLNELIPKEEKENEENKNLIISYCGDTNKRTKLYKDIEWEVKLQLHSLLRNIVKDLDSLSEFEKDNYFVSGIFNLFIK